MTQDQLKSFLNDKNQKQIFWNDKLGAFTYKGFDKEKEELLVKNVLEIARLKETTITLENCSEWKTFVGDFSPETLAMFTVIERMMNNLTKKLRKMS